MQCSRCGYIRFKSSSKCMNCGFAFKKQKSKVLSEAENNFTIFATAGAEAGAVAVDAAAVAGGDLDQKSSSLATDDAELYAPPADTADLNEPNLENSADFELDLSEADDPDSESWDIGATLTEDLSAIENITPEESLNNTDFGSGDFEVQGLGFDLIGGMEQAETKVASEKDTSLPELEYNVFADETTTPEMEPYTGQNEIELELMEDDSVHQDKAEDTFHEPSSHRERLESNDSSAQNPEQISDVELGEISLETELELEDMGMEDSKLKMDSIEDDTNPILQDEESAPDS